MIFSFESKFFESFHLKCGQNWWILGQNCCNLFGFLIFNFTVSCVKNHKNKLGSIYINYTFINTPPPFKNNKFLTIIVEMRKKWLIWIISWGWNLVSFVFGNVFGSYELPSPVAGCIPGDLQMHGHRLGIHCYWGTINFLSLFIVLRHSILQSHKMY